jgi:co-chaperonin GroES (HSP10)
VIRPLRGRCVIREDKCRSSIIIDPGIADERAISTHRGVVLAIGEPAYADPGVEVPWLFGVGDTVQFHFSMMTEKGRTVQWGDSLAVVMAQDEIDAVIELL